MRKSIHTKEHRLLASILRDQREKTGLTQDTMAERLGRPQSYVSDYESGKRGIDMIEMRTICQELGISLGSLVGRFERAAKDL